MDVTVTTKTFQSGNSEAIRLPKEVAFGVGVELTLTRSGDRLIAEPRPKLTPRELVARLREIGPPPDGVQKRLPVDISLKDQSGR